MIRNEIKKNLQVMGVDLEVFDQEMVESFCREMADRNFGHEETLDAFQFYQYGYRDGMKSYQKALRGR